MLSNLEFQISWRYGVPVLIGRLPHVRNDDKSHGFKTKLTITVISHILESTQCFENFRFWDRTLHC